MRRYQEHMADPARKGRWVALCIGVVVAAVLLALAPRWIEAYPGPAGYDLDCADIGHQVRVTGADPYGLDGDGDGWGCERDMSFGWLSWVAVAGLIGFGVWATREVATASSHSQVKER